MMKKLKVYKENGEFVIERVNEFNHATKRRFITEEGLKEGLDAYHPVIHEYEIETSEDVQTLMKVIEQEKKIKRLEAATDYVLTAKPEHYNNVKNMLDDFKYVIKETLEGK